MPPDIQRNTVRNIVILACAVDAADRVLLPATFRALSETMQVGPAELGALSFAQSLSFALALPFWGSMLHYGSARDLLVRGCCLWGFACFALGCTSSFRGQFVLRLLDGFALAAVVPLGQALLCEVVPEDERGRAFGLLQSSTSGLSMTVAAISTATASERFLGIAGWRWAHFIVAGASLVVAQIVRMTLPSAPPEPNMRSHAAWISEQRQLIQKLVHMPSFIILVLQGVAGAVPWNGLAFMTLYFQLSGYSDVQTSQIVFIGGIGGVVGGYLGGSLGDFLGARFPHSGRIMIAQASVVCGTSLFFWVMHIPFGPNSFWTLALAYFSFNTTAVWTSAAASRPICGSIFTRAIERAQVMAVFVALEGVVASICGAPLAGAMSQALGFRLEHSATEKASPESLGALRSALLAVAVVPWFLCAVTWLPMYWTYPKDKERAAEAAEKSTDYKTLCKYGALQDAK